MKDSEIDEIIADTNASSLVTGDMDNIRNAIRLAHERGYVQGMEMARRLLRLQLGLATKEDY